MTKARIIPATPATPAALVAQTAKKIPAVRIVPAIPAELPAEKNNQILKRNFYRRGCWRNNRVFCSRCRFFDFKKLLKAFQKQNFGLKKEGLTDRQAPFLSKPKLPKRENLHWNCTEFSEIDKFKKKTIKTRKNKKTKYEDL